MNHHYEPSDNLKHKSDMNEQNKAVKVKTYSIIQTEYDDGTMKVSRKTTGFSLVELIGMFSTLKDAHTIELLNEMSKSEQNPDRSVATEDAQN